jgi:hypothetical protein
MDKKLAALSDADLAEAVAAQIARPKVAEADSFVLHAPLELLARTALLPYVRPAARDAARSRLAWLGETYAQAGAAIDDPAPARAWDRPADALAALGRAIDAGELDDADAAAGWLAGAMAPADLARALADQVVPLLGAAAHGAIFLYNLPRIAPRSRTAARMLRGLARELAREHAWRLTWQRQRAPEASTSAGHAARGHAAAELLERLRRPRSPGEPVSPFIYPTMSLVERSGLAAELLHGPTRSLEVAEASRLLARVAAWSMLQDDPEHAPYGWSHCLTMPQATLGIAHACADPGEAIAVAATYVLGFRATLGKVAVDPLWRPLEPPGADPLEALSGSPNAAAAAAWHAPGDARPGLVAALAARAATHQDAHLAKYTLACFDAAAADPEASRLYLAAAAYLGGWWAERGGENAMLAS